MEGQTIEETIALLTETIEAQGRSLRNLFEIQKVLSERIKLLEAGRKE